MNWLSSNSCFLAKRPASLRLGQDGPTLSQVLVHHGVSMSVELCASLTEEFNVVVSPCMKIG